MTNPYDQMQSIFSNGAHRMSPEALRVAFMKWDPFTQRFYYDVPEIWRASMCQLGYDVEAMFAEVSRDWPDPNS